MVERELYSTASCVRSASVVSEIIVENRACRVAFSSVRAIHLLYPVGVIGCISADQIHAITNLFDIPGSLTRVIILKGIHKPLQGLKNIDAFVLIIKGIIT